jgi:protein disulfide-isomerase A6
VAPIYEKAAKMFASEENCIVGEINADEDENRSIAATYGVEGFPTFKFFKGDGTVVDYNSGRTLEDFMTFLNTNCNAHRLSDGTLDGHVSTLNLGWQNTGN